MEKQIIVQTGKKQTEKTCQKQRDSWIGRVLLPRTEEHNRNNGISHGRPVKAINKNNEIIYVSKVEAAKQLNICRSSIYYHIKNKKPINGYILECVKLDLLQTAYNTDNED